MIKHIDLTKNNLYVVKNEFSKFFLQQLKTVHIVAIIMFQLTNLVFYRVYFVCFWQRFKSKAILCSPVFAEQKQMIISASAQQLWELDQNLQVILLQFFVRIIVVASPCYLIELWKLSRTNRNFAQKNFDRRH